jgi:hypothetical protein
MSASLATTYVSNSSSAFLSFRLFSPVRDGKRDQSSPRTRGSIQDRKQLGSNQHFDAAGDSGLSSNQPRSFEGEHHLVNRRRADAEVPLQIGLSGWASEHACVSADESQILPLFWGKAWRGRLR